MFYRRALFIFFALLFGMSRFCYSEDTSSQQQLEQIDEELKQLNDLKNRYKAAATRHEDEGIRWQFTQNQKQEAKRAFQRAEMERQMVNEIQIRIDYLEEQKALLLKNKKP